MPIIIYLLIYILYSLNAESSESIRANNGQLESPIKLSKVNDSLDIISLLEANWKNIHIPVAVDTPDGSALIYFNALHQDDDILLNWEVRNEVTGDFEITRQIDENETIVINRSIGDGKLLFNYKDENIRSSGSREISYALFITDGETSTFLGEERVYLADASEYGRRYQTQAYTKGVAREVNDYSLKNLEKVVETFDDPYQSHTLPIVFHYFLDDGESPPSAQFFMDQLDVLNESFNSDPNREDYANPHLEPYLAVSANPQIGFCIPNLVNGQEAIQFYEAPWGIWNIGDAIKRSSNGGADPMNSEQFINIWIGNLEGDFAGFSQMPGGPDQTDGIVIDKRYFGLRLEQKNGLGKTLVHLLGSYLGLYELWNEENPCTDDYVLDTPIHSFQNNYPIDNQTRPVALCQTIETAMINNFMDNSDDRWQMMFTAGQVHRMQAVLSKNGPRHLLTLSSCDDQN